MKPDTSKITSEDVLNAFAVEEKHDRSTLERYLRDFPQYALELTELSHELSRSTVRSGALSSKAKAEIDEAWKKYSTFSPVSTLNIFNALTVPQLRELATKLDVPRQIITAFRERQVIVSSISKRFLTMLAETLDATVDQVTAALSVPLGAEPVRSHKADEKPETSKPATFEELLIQAQVPEEKRRELMAEED